MEKKKIFYIISMILFILSSLFWLFSGFDYEFILQPIITGIIFGFFSQYFIADRFYKIANTKGHYEKCYFWWSFWFSLIGWLMVVALPVRNTTKETKAVENSNNTWKCSKCGRENPTYTGTCVCENSK